VNKKYDELKKKAQGIQASKRRQNAKLGTSKLD